MASTEHIDDDDVNVNSESEEDEEMLKLLEEKMETPDQAARYYDGHVMLIHGLQAAGELERLRAARKRMARFFPLTEDLWLNWLFDEIKLVKLVGKGEIMQLFEAATRDYLSYKIFNLWIDFVKKEGTKEEMHMVASRAIREVGYHFQGASHIWKAILSNENEVAVSPDMAEKCYFAPIPNLDRSIKCLQEEMTKDETNQKITHVRSLVSDMEPFEKQLASFPQIDNPGSPGGTPKLRSIWFEYIDMIASREKKLRKVVPEMNVKRLLHCLHERAIASCCLDPMVWNRCLRFLVQQPSILKEAPDILGLTSERALRNCPCEFSLWEMRFRGLEMRPNVTFQEIVPELGKLLDQSLQCEFPSQERHVDLLLMVCHIYRRLILGSDSSSTSPRGDLGAMKKQLFDQYEYTRMVVNQLFATPTLLAKVLEEYTITLTDKRIVGDDQDEEKCSQLWLDALEQDPAQIKLYLAGIRHFRRVGDLENCRKIYKMGLFEFKKLGDAGKPLSNARTLASSWIQMESFDGTSKTLQIAERTTASLFPMKKNDTNDNENQEKKKSKTNVKRKREDEEVDDQEKVKAKKPKQKQRDEKVAAVKPRDRSVFVVNLSYKALENDIEQHFASVGQVENVDLKRGKNGNSKAVCVVTFVDQRSVEKAFHKLQGSSHMGRVLELRPMKGTSPAVTTTTRAAPNTMQVEQNAQVLARSVFVSKIPGSFCSEENIRNGTTSFEVALRNCGGIETIKIARNKTSMIVCFDDPVAATKALKLDGQTFKWNDEETHEVKVDHVRSKYDHPNPQQRNPKTNGGGTSRKRKIQVPAAGVVVDGQANKRSTINNEEGEAKTGSKMKSNDDFRKMFFSSSSKK